MTRRRSENELLWALIIMGALVAGHAIMTFCSAGASSSNFDPRFSGGVKSENATVNCPDNTTPSDPRVWRSYQGQISKERQ